MNKKIIFSILAAIFANFLISTKVYAICPVCTVAVAGGVGLSRWLGIDDLMKK